MKLSRVQIRNLVETTDDLPALPQIWLRVRRVTEDLRASAQDVAEVVLKDQAMTARLLKAANSAIYAGYHQRITTVTNAVVLLGFKEVRNIVLGYAAYHMLNKLKKSKSFDFQSFWVHSLATAVAAKMLGEAIQYELPEEAFVAGLLHDIGKLIAAYLFPQPYSEVLKKAETGGDILQIEREALHVDHQEIGQWAANRWSFPNVLQQAIALHHRTGLREKEKHANRLVDLTAVADGMAKIIFRTGPEASRPDPKSSQRAAEFLLGVDRDRWGAILRDLAANVRKLIDEFNLKPEDLEAYTEFLEESQQEHARTERFYEDMNRELTEKVKELNTLHQFSAALLQCEDAGEIQHLLLESIYRAVNFSRVLLFLPDQDNNELQAAEGLGTDVQPLLKKGGISLQDKGALVTAFKEGQVVNILNAVSPLYADAVSQSELELLKCAAFACVPIAVRGGVLGVLVLDNHVSGEAVPDHRLSTVLTLVNQAALALQHAPVPA